MKLVVFSLLAILTNIAQAAPETQPTPQAAVVYAKVIYVLKNPPREKDRPEPWIAKELTARGHTHFMAVSGWVRLSDQANESTSIWNGASDWIDDGQHVLACPGSARIMQRGGDGNMTIKLGSFLPVANEVRVEVADKLGTQTVAMVVKDRVYVALHVGQPPETPAIQPTTAQAVEQRLKVDDFWSNGGARTQHDEFTTGELAFMRELAAMSNDAVVRIRANKIVCDLHGRMRIPDGIPPARAAEAIEAAFRHLETNLKDPTIASFRPELGFTHIGLAQRDKDDGNLWLLMEVVDPVLPNGGLNVRWNGRTVKIDKVEHWGTLRNIQP
ncbi:MAG: hypothetical protein ACHRHE_22370 [Tepidisphaerales bacterium]